MVQCKSYPNVVLRLACADNAGNDWADCDANSQLKVLQCVLVDRFQSFHQLDGEAKYGEHMTAFVFK